MQITLKEQRIELLPEKAFFWREKKILGLSDVHLGKATTLQKMGVPVPQSASKDLERLRSLLVKTKPESVYVLGDWIHQSNSWTQELFDEMDDFFHQFSHIHWQLLVGNHERGSLKYLRELPFDLIEEEKKVGPFTFSHGHQKMDSDDFFIQGHIHPVVVIKEGSLRMRLPCFILTEYGLTLPSFGDLTGGYEICRGKKDEIYAVTGQTVFKVP